MRAHPERRVGRYYDPTTGQFLTVDPLVEQTGAAYAYVAGDPVNSVDLNGLGGILGTGININLPSPTGLVHQGEDLVAAGYHEANSGLNDLEQYGSETWSALQAANDEYETLLNDATTYIVEHRGQFAEWVAAGVCVAQPEVCAGAITVAFVISTLQNADNASVTSTAFWKSEGVTAMETFLAGGAGALSAGMEAANMFDMQVGGAFFEAGEGSSWLPGSQLGRRLLNLPGAVSSAWVTWAEPSIKANALGPSTQCP